MGVLCLRGCVVLQRCSRWVLLVALVWRLDSLFVCVLFIVVLVVICVFLWVCDVLLLVLGFIAACDSWVCVISLILLLYCEI